MCTQRIDTLVYKQNVLVSLDNKTGRYLPDFVDLGLDWGTVRGREIQNVGDVVEAARGLWGVLLWVAVGDEWSGRCAFKIIYNYTYLNNMRNIYFLIIYKRNILFSYTNYFNIFLKLWQNFDKKVDLIFDVGSLRI